MVVREQPGALGVAGVPGVPGQRVGEERDQMRAATFGCQGTCLGFLEVVEVQPDAEVVVGDSHGLLKRRGVHRRHRHR